MNRAPTADLGVRACGDPRRFPIIIAVFAKLILICALAIAAWLPAAAAQTQPNIIVIMTDDQDDFASVNVMPAVRLWLKQRGVWFTNSFTNFPVCCPSRASLLSGKAAHNHGVLGNTPNTGGGYAAFIDQSAGVSQFPCRRRYPFRCRLYSGNTCATNCAGGRRSATY